LRHFIDVLVEAAEALKATPLVGLSQAEGRCGQIGCTIMVPHSHDEREPWRITLGRAAQPGLSLPGRDAREAIARIVAAHGATQPWWWDAAFDDGSDKTAAQQRASDLETADAILALSPPISGGTDVREAIRKAKVAADKTYGIAWHNLEEISRFELFLAALSTIQDGSVREALAKCRAQFDFYVEQHMAKTPPDVDKAATNQEFVELCDAALSTIPQSPAPISGDASVGRDAIADVLRKALSEECDAVGHPDGKSRTKIIIEAINSIEALYGSCPADGWQTIDSAPKDGTEFLAGWLDRDTITKATFTGDGRLVDVEDWSGWISGGEPTHWHPLPAPPVKSPQAETIKP
jgi:hypothetical protein